MATSLQLNITYLEDFEEYYTKLVETRIKLIVCLKLNPSLGVPRVF